MRILLEGLALRHSIERGDVGWEAQVVSTHHVLDRIPFRAEGDLGASDEWSIAHAAFHSALGAGCGSLRLQEMTHLLRDSSEIYRQLSLPVELESKRDVGAEHRELMELAVARQADKAVEALCRHFQRTTDLRLEYVLLEP